VERREAVNDALVLLLAGAALFFWRLGSHDLWPPDEPRSGLVAREMWAKGEYVVLSLHDRLYTDKPPLFFWAINGFGRILGGVDEWAARLPSAASGLLCLFLVHRLGTWLYDRRTGLVAALVFATSFQIAERARWASIDMTLNLFVLAAILLFWRGRQRPQAGRGCFRLAWACMGLATLAKGPVGLVLPILATLPAALLARDFRAARRMFLPSGIALYLAVTLSWFGLFALRIGLGSALEVLVQQNVVRYVDAWNARHPVWFYLWRFPAGFLPWILFLPSGVAAALAPEERDRKDAALFLLTWIAAILVFFSFSTGKRGVHVIPVYPAAAILVASLMARAPQRRLRRPVLAWAGGAGVLAVALPLLAARLDRTLIPAAAAIGGLLLLGGTGAAILLSRQRAAGAVPCLIGSMALVLLVTVEGIVPWVNRHANLRGFAEQVRSHLRPAAAFGTTRRKRDAWVFYTGRFAEMLDTPVSVREYLARDGPRFLVIEARVLREIGGNLPAGTTEILRDRVAGGDRLLLGRGILAVRTPGEDREAHR
jgi:4-amino-4-deoxy-L-arabinose transferase-like glycosyltransferase